jgi:hypothetical protein
MPRLSISPDTLEAWGSCYSRPTMLLAAVVNLADDFGDVSILKCFHGKPMMDLINQVQSDATQTVVSLLIATPPHVNLTARWKVDVIDDFGRATIRDRQGATFTTYAYRTSNGSVFIDNALLDPTYIRNWKSRLRVPGDPKSDTTQSPDLPGRLAALLTTLVNEMHLPSSDEDIEGHHE